VNLFVVAGHSRSANGVASLAYGFGSPSFSLKMDMRAEPACDVTASVMRRTGPRITY
jgi:hypothetical protein